MRLHFFDGDEYACTHAEGVGLVSRPTSTALSELAQSLRGCELRRMTRSDFETIVRKHLSGSHVDQQIAQLWDKVSSSVIANYNEFRGLIRVL